MSTERMGLREEAWAFAKTHVREGARELLALHATGILADGKVRELGRLNAKWAGESTFALDLAKSMIVDEALKMAAADIK